jgi:GT2 family glycosyltransferase
MVFSIAVPVYGQSGFLTTAMDSIAAQSAAVQLAVMDATPDDSVQEVVRRYAGGIHYSRHGADEGQSAAIQEGWDRTAGDIVGWLCADDCLFPGALTDVEKVFSDQPDVDVVYGDGIFIDQDGRFIRYFPSISADIARITRDCCISQPSCFVRRTAMEHVGGVRKDLHYTMDWDLWTRLHLAGCRFHYLQRPLSASRMHPGTKTTGNSNARIREMWWHLVRYNPLHTALRSMAGVQLAPLVYRELGPKDETALGRYTRRATQIVRRGWRFAGRKATRSLYGLEIGTNAVQQRCEIHLPFYGDSSPTRLEVHTAEDIPLTAAIDGQPLAIASDHSPRRHVFRMPAQLGGRQLSFRFELDSPATGRWRLESAQVA